MDYEKKYNDALNLAKSYYGKGCNEFLDTIFPELNESEEERIINQLITLVNSAGEVLLIPTNKEELIAYLEKQKESLHISEMYKENADSFTDEDERIRKWLVDYFKAVERCWIHWDISPERIVSYLERQKEQKQEWSEEDEKMLDEVLDRVTYAFYNQGLDGEIEDDPAFLWLHRLRPSWKPSKEQMRVLSWAANGMVDKSIAAPEMRAVLRELYNDLKKLGVKEDPEYYQHFDQDC